MSTERSLVKSILAYLNSLPGCLARKRWGGGMGVAGDPDIDACVHGRSVQLEVKRPGEQPTALQVKRLDEWRRAGAVVAVVNSVADVRALLEKSEFLSRTNPPGPAYIVTENGSTGEREERSRRKSSPTTI